MILGLAIRGLGVIDDAEIELGPGLTVLTGETGAGKTMVLTGLGLLLGGRTDAGIVREGHAAAVIEGRFTADGFARENLGAVVDDAGGAWDEDGSLLLARTVSAEGRSRAHLGGRSVPAASLVSAGGLLVAVHGQDDQHRLLQPAQQRAALDRFAGAGAAEALDAYRATFGALLDTRARLRDVMDHARERRREAEDLAEMIALITSVGPRPGEEESLRAESERLSHVDELMQAVAAARESLADDAFARAAAALVRAAERDPQLDEMRQRLMRAQEEVDDVALDLVRYAESLDADPARLAHVEERRAALGSLRRRLDLLAPGVTDPAEWRIGAEARLAELGDDESLIADLRSQESALLSRASREAMALSTLRREAAGRLGVAVSAELAALAMPKARLEVAVHRRGDRGGDVVLEIDGSPVAADRHGVDDIEFLLIPRESSPARPLGKGASGGERSRIMLALEVVFAGLDPMPTFVFDEVDAGVGGKAAVEVGRRLARLARGAQVVVVTHLPQVAAFATRHLVVRSGDAMTSVAEVTGEERARELARMLAGLEGSATAVAHAEELLSLAAQEADGPGTSKPATEGRPDAPSAGRARRATRAR